MLAVITMVTLRNIAVISDEFSIVGILNSRSFCGEIWSWNV